jgi:hypothetical protein
MLLADTVVGGEAHLRLGVTLVRAGRRDAAAPHFDAAAVSSGDVFVKYLAHLFAGRALSNAGNVDAGRGRLSLGARGPAARPIGGDAADVASLHESPAAGGGSGRGRSALLTGGAVRPLAAISAR